MSSGPALVLISGTLTFGNEFLQKDKINWRVPVATILGAWFVEGISKVSDKGATALGVMVLIAAAANKSAGKSPFEELASITPRKG